MNYLLDTCVISELVAKRPNRGVVEWIDAAGEERIYLSVVTVGEIQKGIEKLVDARRKEKLRGWLHDELLIRFRDRLVVVDTGVMLEWGVLMAALDRRGAPMPAIDSLLAASALRNHLVLVTRNEDDFLRAGVELLNPWN